MSALRLERDGPVLRITLARPERRNAFDAALIAELSKAFADVGDARAVVLTGEGKAFCAGADVEWQRASIDLSYEENVADALRLYAMCEAIDLCPAPVIAGVHGYALGGGSGLVACSDIVVADADTVFGFTEVRLGIIPAVVSPYVVRKIGPGHATALFASGIRFDARRAMDIGLVEAVESPEELDAKLALYLDAIVAGGPRAVTAAKQLVRDVAGRPAADVRELMVTRIAEIRVSAEGQEGMRAFLERRKARWDT